MDALSHLYINSLKIQEESQEVLILLSASENRIIVNINQQSSINGAFSQIQSGIFGRRNEGQVQ
jgi:hypothetical protein